MLGRTNLVLNELSDDVSLVRESILTNFSIDIHKLKYINNKFFVINTGMRSFIYGDSIDLLRKVDMSGYPDNVIFANGVYYISTSKGLFSSTDLENFSEVATEISINSNSMIFYDENADKFIIVNYESYPYSQNSSGQIYYFKTVLYTTADLAGEWNQLTIMTDSATSFDFSAMYANNRVMYSQNSKYYVFDLNGGKSSSSYFTDIYAGGYFWIVKNNVLYKSMNGGDYSKVYTYNSDELSEMKFVKNYNGYIAFVGYVRMVDGAYKYFIAVAADASVTAVEKAMQNKVEFVSDYPIYDMTCVDDIIYFGSSSGIIIKAQFGNEEGEIPADVILIKTLSAKQALAEAKSYTDEQITTLKARILTLEEKITALENVASE